MLCAPHPQCRLEKVGLATGGVGVGKVHLMEGRGCAKAQNQGLFRGMAKFRILGERK